jgi:starvation-inducible outer membrane lipoprotein
MRKMAMDAKDNGKRMILLVSICMALSGCALLPGSRLNRQARQLKESLSRAEVTLLNRDEEIRKLNKLLKEKDAQLKEKDDKIELMRKKLESLGVF